VYRIARPSQQRVQIDQSLGQRIAVGAIGIEAAPFEFCKDVAHGVAAVIGGK